MLDQVGISFSDGAPVIAELSLIRVSEIYLDLNVGGELSLINLVL
jgi:hypothetical protein